VYIRLETTIKHCKKFNFVTMFANSIERLSVSEDKSTAVKTPACQKANGFQKCPNKKTTKCGKSCRESLKTLTLFDTLESDGVFAVFDHSMDVPGGESSHRGIIDFQEEFIRPQFAAVAHRCAREKLADNRELSILCAALQLQPQLPLLIPAKDTLMDFVSPVVLPLLQGLGHGSNKGKSHECGRGRSFSVLCAPVSAPHCNVSSFSSKRHLYPCQRAAAGSSVRLCINWELLNL